MSQGNWQGDGGTTSRVHAEFLTGLQELPSDVLFMAAANRVADLSPEIMRAERFDKILFVGFPTEAERTDIFRVHLAGDPNLDSINIGHLAAASKLFTGAEIQSVIRETRFEVSLAERRAMTTNDLLSHIASFKNRMWLRKQEEMIQMYRIALNEWDWASTEQREEAAAIVNAGGRKDVVTAGGTSMKRFT
jgi:SpoVK/Ycf46/Vps4 family AAA+-type ATPase